MNFKLLIEELLVDNFLLEKSLAELSNFDYFAFKLLSKEDQKLTFLVLDTIIKHKIDIFEGSKLWNKILEIRKDYNSKFISICDIILLKQY